MPDTRVGKHPEDHHHFGGGNPSPTMQHPVINLGGLVDGLETVPDTAPGLPPYPHAVGLAPQNAMRDLHWIRSQFPFLSITPFPRVVTKVLTAGQAQRLDLPSATVLVMFKGTGDFWLSWQGNAAVPTLVNNDVNQEVPDTGVYDPTNQWFYVAQPMQLSVISSAPVIVQALCLMYRTTEKR